MTCCGIINFEQHCISKKQLRKVAGMAYAKASSDNLLALPQEGTTTNGPASELVSGTTYMGCQAQCFTYYKQVHTDSSCCGHLQYLDDCKGSLLWFNHG